MFKKFRIYLYSSFGLIPALILVSIFVIRIFEVTEYNPLAFAYIPIIFLMAGPFLIKEYLIWIVIGNIIGFLLVTNHNKKQEKLKTNKVFLINILLSFPASFLILSTMLIIVVLTWLVISPLSLQI